MIATETKIDSKTGEVVEPQKPQKREILVDEKLPFYKFGFKQLSVKEVDKKPVRSLQLILLNYLSKVFFAYDVALVCDTEPLENKIAAVKKAKLEYETSLQDTLPDIKEKDLKKYDDQVRDLEVKIAELKIACPTITFETRVQKVDDSGEYLKVELLISKETANLLNDTWEMTENYKIQLQHANV